MLRRHGDMDDGVNIVLGRWISDHTRDYDSGRRRLRSRCVLAAARFNRTSASGPEPDVDRPLHLKPLQTNRS